MNHSSHHERHRRHVARPPAIDHDGAQAADHLEHPSALSRNVSQWRHPDESSSVLPMDRDELIRVLRAFEAERLEYVLIGATAMGLHGLIRSREF